MSHTRRGLLAAVGGTLSLPLAGCTGGGYSAGSEATTDDSPTTEAGTADGGAVVRVGSHPEFGEILTGPEGLTLYMFEQDTNGASSSACTDGCADAWPPLTVESTDRDLAGDAVTAGVGTFDRADGSTQVTVAGWPLYYFESDEAPGDAAGQGVQDAWWVLGPDGSVIRSTAQTTTPSTTDSDDMGGGY